jgi:hypothetical protein
VGESGVAASPTAETTPYSEIFTRHLDGRKLLILFGRGGQIRTGDPLRPRQVRYQAALRPDMCGPFNSKLLAGVRAETDYFTKLPPIR